MKKLKVLVCGSKGQLGSELGVLAETNRVFEFWFTDLPELDITSVIAVDKALNDFKPDFLVNCAAFTAVDKAETEQEMAMLVNTTAPGILARACSKHQCHLIHISTDYVFDGKAFQPYKESDKVGPDSFYGLSKLKGEEEVKASGATAWIIRTSWLYSTFGHNFLKTILHHGALKEELRVVFDQIGSPTYARDLALTILQMISSGNTSKNVSIYHYSNEGVCSWYDFALAIIAHTQLHCNIIPITSDQYPLPAPRPFYSVLNKEKIKSDFNISVPHWSESLRDCYSRL
ncbi:MAG: dTDP-4-dehydrorhamnose reductase [Bacteroidales bacterium]|nr:dTDP-4-dehydrorhamnose reductase [Bacteroidales bacterium]